ncbi:MAG: hypothetical protein Q4F11_01100 [Eubacteriales bacterium]|nr:hypothetical protein [Eubacteriales bacterium]
MKLLKNQRIKPGIICFLLFLSSLILLLLFNGDSPLYFFNTAPDNTVYKTVAKRMLGGDILYLDIYEHKGLYLYFYYIIKEFVQPFVVELVLDLCFVFFAYKSLRIFQNRQCAFMCTLLINVIDKSFGYLYHFGGQSETIGKVILMILIYIIIRNYNVQRHDTMQLHVCFITGILTAVLFMIKYTMTIFVLAFALTLFIAARKKSCIEHFIKCFCSFLGGFAIGFIPALIYFAVTGSFKAFIQIYLFDVSTQYNPAKFNIEPVVFVALVILFVLFAMKKNVKPLDMLFVSSIASLIFTAVATRVYYFGMYIPLIVIIFIIADPVIKQIQYLVNESSPIGRIFAFLLYMGVLLSLPASFSANMDFMTKEGFARVTNGYDGSLKDLVDIINASDDKTLLTRSDNCILYLMTNTLPDTKYFINYNMVLEKHSTAYALSSYKESKNYVNDAFNQYIDEGSHEFIFQYACNYINTSLYEKVGAYCCNGNYGKMEVMVLYRRR